MVNLGFWQLRRLDTRQELNARILGRSERTAEKFEDVLGDIDSVAEGRSIDYRHVWLRGTYQPEREVIVAGQSSGGAPGRWIATPLVTDEGRTVLVLRGHLAAVADDVDPPIDQAEPPSGEVELRGYVRRSQERQGLEPAAPELEAHQYARLELPRIAAREGIEDLEPVLVQLQDQDPPTDAPLLRPIALPELTEGSHFSYAIQWYIFSIIAVVGYPLVLRRTARNRAATAAAEPDEVSAPPEPAATSG